MVQRSSLSTGFDADCAAAGGSGAGAGCSVARGRADSGGVWTVVIRLPPACAT